jgi:uncharacterized protein
MKVRLPAHANPCIDPITNILREAESIAVVGLSSNPTRPSYGVAQYLQSVGYRVIPVNPKESKILGQKSFARLEDIPDRVDVVDVFRRPEHIPSIAESAIKIVAKTLWLQLGIENSAAAAQAQAAGLNVIEDACLLVEHKKRRQLLAPKS